MHILVCRLQVVDIHHINHEPQAVLCIANISPGAELANPELSAAEHWQDINVFFPLWRLRHLLTLPARLMGNAMVLCVQLVHVWMCSVVQERPHHPKAEMETESRQATMRDICRINRKEQNCPHMNRHCHSNDGNAQTYLDPTRNNNSEWALAQQQWESSDRTQTLGGGGAEVKHEQPSSRCCPKSGRGARMVNQTAPQENSLELR